MFWLFLCASMQLLALPLLCVSCVSGPVGYRVSHFLTWPGKLGLWSLSLCALRTQKSPAEAGTVRCRSAGPWRRQALFPLMQKFGDSCEVEQERRHLGCFVARCLEGSSRGGEVCIRVAPYRKECAEWVNAASRGRRQRYQLSFSFSSFLLLPKKKSLNIFF